MLHAPMHHTQAIHQLFTYLRSQLDTCLPANLAGLYVRGSLATGDFRPDSSDIDLLAVTYQRVSDEEFDCLSELHAAFSQSDHPFARRVEIAYIDRYALRRFQPGQSFPTLGQGETLAWTEHRANWVLERWMVREQGVALFGPLPMTLIYPVSRQEVIAATRDRLLDWAAWANDHSDPHWQAPRAHKFYVIETICRSLHTLATGEIASKPAATAWAHQSLPAPWPGLIERSRKWRLDDTVDPDAIEPVREFVLWAAARSQDEGP
jgi:hypothetical protein